MAVRGVEHEHVTPGCDELRSPLERIRADSDRGATRRRP